MNVDELKEKILELMPDALFDEEFGTDELMISTGLLVRPDGKLEGMHVFGKN